MLKRTLFFQNEYHLHVRNDQLLVEQKELNKTISSIPLEDVGFIVCEHPRITFSTAVVQLIAEHNASLIFCDNKFHPCAFVSPVDGNYVQQERIRSQIEASEPLKKNLWQQIVKSKLLQQAAVLKEQNLNEEPLQQKARRVLSGDSSFEEAKGAKIYWNTLFGSEFKRERKGDEPNAALNYGYAILRAAVARALAGAGLHPSFGLHHRNKYNAFCLADDVMEPFRPFVDRLVLEMTSLNLATGELDKKSKVHLLKVLAMDVRIKNQMRPLMVSVQQTCNSLVNCLAGENKKIIVPDENQSF